LGDILTTFADVLQYKAKTLTYTNHELSDYPSIIFS